MLQKYFSNITFDKKEHLPLEVVMTEEGGDTTTITLKKN